MYCYSSLNYDAVIYKHRTLHSGVNLLQDVPLMQHPNGQLFDGSRAASPLYLARLLSSAAEKVWIQSAILYTLPSTV